MAIKSAHTAILLTVAATPATAGISCPADKIEAVELISKHETLQQSNPGILDRGHGRVEVKHYFSRKGDEYVLENGENRLPDVDAFAATGNLSNRWEPYVKETWRTGTEAYRSYRNEKGENNKRSKIMPRDHNPAVAIESVKPGNNTSTVAGFNCRKVQKTLPNGTTISTCNLKIYGLNQPLGGQKLYKDGSHQTTQVLSLEQLCVEESLFKVPDRNWK